MTLLDISKMKKGGTPQSTPSAPEIKQAAAVEQMMVKPEAPTPLAASATSQIQPPAATIAPSPPGPQTVLTDPNYENIVKALKETEWLLTQDKTKAMSKYAEIKNLYHNLNHEEKEKVYNECIDIFSKLG